MHETPEELSRLQQILDASAAAAGPHLRNVIGEERRLDAAAMCETLQGMRLLVLATVTADGRPLTGPVDGYFIHGTFWFGSARNSVRMRHLAARPGVSATHLPGEQLSVVVHGRAELFDVLDPAHGELRQEMLDFYLPKQGPDFEAWLREMNPIGARIEPEKVFTFQLSP
jgi:Pyridoxamine 5'-phosphate oxidase